ncbi:MAG: hypothetical protein QOC85_1264, partial [Streptomyces sp.]|nr:hypothetical protein [Streptomyces sp.]
MSLFTRSQRSPAPDKATQHEGADADSGADTAAEADPGTGSHGWRARYPVPARAVAWGTSALALA